MILLPREVNLVLLSATIDSPEFFAGWLGDLKKKPIHLISTTYRIVPLQHAVVRAADFLTIMDNKEQFEGGLYKGWLQWRLGLAKGADDHRARVAERRRGGYEDPSISRSAGGPKAFKWQLNDLVARLESEVLLPALFFVLNRKDCERYAAAVEHTLIDSSDTAAVKHILDFHLHRYGDALLRLQQYQTLRGLLERGIAFHHSGLLPVLKEIVEILFCRGYVKVLFATETFAVGINMPTKTVVFTGYRKYDDATGGMRMLNTDEYIQMAGRAGRRGKDDKGLVLYLPDREPESLEDVKRMMTGAKATFQSRMTFGYDFLLKTLQAGSLDWLHVMKQSYWYKRYEQTFQACQRELAALEAEKAGLGLTEEDLGELLERERLAEALRGAVNAARKKAQQEWGAWENRHGGARWAGLLKGRAKKEIRDMEDPTVDVWARLASLGAMGFLENPVGPDHPLKLTELGTMATEVNEGHPLLMSVAFEKGLFAGLSADETVVALAAFIREGGEEDGSSCNIPVAIKEALGAVEGEAYQLDRLEKIKNDADDYWTLSTAWLEPLWRWLEGATAAEICADYDLYEGNFMRILLKTVNLVEEWRSIATLKKSVEELEKLRGIEVRILREVAVSDSLYLRI
jgi:superfamily II RNA helicase